MRRLVTRAIVVLGAVFIGGEVMRSLPHDQTLIFPVGSSFPNARRFSATWQVPGSREPSGGVTLSFADPPPLQVRAHARLPNGDYTVTIVVESPADERAGRELKKPPAEAANRESAAENSFSSAGLKTTAERRVNLAGGETTIALPAGTSPLE